MNLDDKVRQFMDAWCWSVENQFFLKPCPHEQIECVSEHIMQRVM